MGPLRFGMSPDEVAKALSVVAAETGRDGGLRRDPGSTGAIEVRVCDDLGLLLCFAGERLRGIVVDALCGPQVHGEGRALVGQVPSVLERWLFDRAQAREPDPDLTYLTAGVPCSETLGVIVNVQRAGDHLLTRPVFIPAEGLEGMYYFLPERVWAIPH
ncbi:hypothetical protein LN042_08905 [Kitasatospora sp. RB6PN24]|uniref:hypothetical protein n=1 Tax=Kitasatospora humi TaxID=2893891 RepID=UPI001E537B80|nr:hypothetical protein [Kitasatospora humi]MCC9307218.1 hypothetical protein [Kitasatospora humi]